jgi:hypothetical protein
MLVFRRLMREEKDPKVRLALLCGKLEDAFATVFRQVAMTRFEQALHEARRSEGELPLERVNQLWMDANRPMFGDSVSLSDDYAWWWLYIPHFVHSPFYCYAYAFGELLVLALLRRYDAEGARSCRAISRCSRQAAPTRPSAARADRARHRRSRVLGRGPRPARGPARAGRDARRRARRCGVRIALGESATRRRRPHRGPAPRRRPSPSRRRPVSSRPSSCP